MVVNGDSLLMASPIKDMLTNKVSEHGVSHGLAEVGYDIRLKQEVCFRRPTNFDRMTAFVDGVRSGRRFCIASAIEEFMMPANLVGMSGNIRTRPTGPSAQRSSNYEQRRENPGRAHCVPLGR